MRSRAPGWLLGLLLALVSALTPSVPGPAGAVAFPVGAVARAVAATAVDAPGELTAPGAPVAPPAAEHLAVRSGGPAGTTPGPAAALLAGPALLLALGLLLRGVPGRAVPVRRPPTSRRGRAPPRGQVLPAI